MKKKIHKNTLLAIQRRGHSTMPPSLNTPCLEPILSCEVKISQFFCKTSLFSTYKGNFFVFAYLQYQYFFTVCGLGVNQIIKGMP